MIKPLVAIFVFALGLLAPAFAQKPDMRISSKKVRDEVGAVVGAQLTALQKGDFATAYDFAARGIRRQFDERLFAAMIRRGYPALLRPGARDLGIVRDDGEGAAEVTVTVTDAQKRSTVYRYMLTQEEGVWRIGTVVLEQRPPRGDI